MVIDESPPPLPALPALPALPHAQADPPQTEPLVLVLPRPTHQQPPLTVASNYNNNEIKINNFGQGFANAVNIW